MVGGTSYLILLPPYDFNDPILQQFRAGPVMSLVVMLRTEGYHVVGRVGPPRTQGALPASSPGRCACGWLVNLGLLFRPPSKK
jgi:hypothetical protein